MYKMYISVREAKTKNMGGMMVGNAVADRNQRNIYIYRTAESKHITAGAYYIYNGAISAFAFSAHI
jgi:hypothetical protein